MERKVSDVLFSSNSAEWETPDDLFALLDSEFHFTVDLCANSNNYKVDRYYSKDNDGMKADLYGEIVYCNPPYGRNVGKWVKKCAFSGATCVMLLPARTDTRWFHDYIYNKAEVRFIKGRLHFNNSKRGAPFPSMIVVFRGDNNG